MSADNGIYILQTKDGYRVKHMQAVENLWWSKGKQLDEMNPVKVYLAFKDAPEFPDKATAFEFAFEEENNYDILEYGVSELDDIFAEITFEELQQKAVELTKEEIKWFQKDQKKRVQSDFWKYAIDERKQLIKSYEIQQDFKKLISDNTL